jgi:hypothetical protein
MTFAFAAGLVAAALYMSALFFFEGTSWLYRGRETSRMSAFMDKAVLPVSDRPSRTGERCTYDFKFDLYECRNRVGPSLVEVRERLATRHIAEIELHKGESSWLPGTISHVTPLIGLACGLDEREADLVRNFLLDPSNADVVTKGYAVGSARDCGFMLSEAMLLVSIRSPDAEQGQPRRPSPLIPGVGDARG